MSDVNNATSAAQGATYDAYWNGFGYRVMWRTFDGDTWLHRVGSPDGYAWYSLNDDGSTTFRQRVGVMVRFTGGPRRGQVDTI